MTNFPVASGNSNRNLGQVVDVDFGFILSFEQITMYLYIDHRELMAQQIATGCCHS